MHKITVMGTSDKLKNIANSDNTKVLLRTEISKAYDTLKSRGVDFATLDFIYDRAGDFNELDELLAQEVMKAAAESDVIYVVSSSAVTGEGSVKEIISRYDNVEVIPGDAPEYGLLSAVSGADASSGYAVIPASCLERGTFSPRLPLVVTALDNGLLLSDIKLLLAEEYGDEHIVFIGRDKSYSKIRLYEMDRFEGCDHNTMLFVPEKTKESRYDLFELEEVFKKLRSPEGCPWDRQQTHASLKRYLLEECAEVLDAIDGGDMSELMDELGDVLLQVLFHATIASERGDFAMRDVTDNLVRKLIKRHPHVFADASAESPEEVLKQWDEIKHEDKKDKSIAAKLESVPRSMTALMRAQKVLSRAAKAEFFPEEENDLDSALKSIELLLEKIHEKNGGPGELVGDLLFNAANLSRILGIESELVLQDATKRNIEKFAGLEHGKKKY